MNDHTSPIAVAEETSDGIIEAAMGGGIMGGQRREREKRFCKGPAQAPTRRRGRRQACLQAMFDFAARSRPLANEKSPASRLLHPKKRQIATELQCDKMRARLD